MKNVLLVNDSQENLYKRNFNLLIFYVELYFGFLDFISSFFK
ncbi:hypothetical protein LEP1GSC037_4771 [Leptospira interrogans str. 2006001854]|uniref:Uncharacterized protein n=1 Tax=Leptospira interrogans str. 2006001854 TaxID=1001590 RepID=M6GGL8_LEPIR|nr:hypothetical protein LEP1GSC037_4771 [Leptospira interrogans str. 2006001854]